MRSSRCPDGLAAEAIGHLSGSFNSIERGVGRLLTCDVLAGGLSQLFAGCGLIQQVVGDLKSQSVFLPIFGNRVQFVIAGAADDRAYSHRAANPSSGLAAVNLFEI